MGSAPLTAASLHTDVDTSPCCRRVAGVCLCAAVGTPVLGRPEEEARWLALPVLGVPERHCPQRGSTCPPVSAQWSHWLRPTPGSLSPGPWPRPLQLFTGGLISKAHPSRATQGPVLIRDREAPSTILVGARAWCPTLLPPTWRMALVGFTACCLELGFFKRVFSFHLVRVLKMLDCHGNGAC